MTQGVVTSSNLWSEWKRHARETPSRDAIIHWSAHGPAFRWTYGALIRTAETFARMAVEQNIAKGEVCAIIVRHHPMFYPLYLGICCIGAIPAVLAYPNSRLHPDKFRHGLEGMSRRSGLDWIFCERDLESVIRPLVESSDSTIKGMRFPLDWVSELSLQDDGPGEQPEMACHANNADPLLLQHSSGTTGLQKPVLLSNSAVQEHVTRYADAIGLRYDDKVVNWLPLYHDMGLIAAFHLPLAFGIPTVLISPFEWVIAPSILLEAVSEEHGTITWLPNFAYDLMADKLKPEDLEGIDLSHWRMVINCSEPIRHESHQKFINRFEPYGLRRSALSTCYAMAETTFGVTQTPPDTQPAVRALDRAALAKGQAVDARLGAPVRLCVSSGTPIGGCDVRVVDADGHQVKDGTVGEIAVRSASLFDGYRNYPEKTAEVLREGWYYSGDYGFRDGTNYFVVGRKKDVIIVGGNNIYPEDVEAEVGVIEGVLAGRVVAFGDEDPTVGSERLCVIAETSITDGSALASLRTAIVKAGMAINVSISRVYLVAPRFLIKSSAGKLSRKANKDRVLSFEDVPPVNAEFLPSVRHAND